MGIGFKDPIQEIMRLYITGLCFQLLCTGQLFVQQTRAALFLGNSYTYVK